MRKKILYGAVLCIMVGCQSQPATFDADQELDYCAAQVGKALEAMQDGDGTFDYTMEPRNILEGETVWNCRKATAEEWCSGFWPGVLWMTYESEKIKNKKYESATAIPLDSLRRIAEGYTDVLSFLGSQPVYDHDLGFLVINSFLKGYEATGNEQYKQIALAAADTLATLYNEKVGTLLSWPRHVKDYGGHNTIMDNMINLELLFWANEQHSQSANATSVNRKLYDIAVSHADTTMRYHFRPDGSCYHVAVYDTLTGNFLRGQTHQGYADESMWARGQSWAIYGYTMVYRYTKEQRFLDHARKVADIYLQRLQENSDDWVPMWDLDDPRGKEAPKDASAACVIASALLELCQYTADDGDSQSVNGKSVNSKYYGAAEQMLRSLSSDRYQSRDRNCAFLLHSTGHHPAGSEIDASIIYADYYYIEALLRWKSLN
ncbi:MAG: glycoside hydrolase family 88 protein [Prevotella sp.]|nr:glycoside hydrolase family 88 protein [Prevotella sp.]